MKKIKSKGFKVVDQDFERPWGGFLVIDEKQAQDFSDSFFNGIDVSELKISGKLSPKILMVKSNQGYHGNITLEERGNLERT